MLRLLLLLLRLLLRLRLLLLRGWRWRIDERRNTLTGAEREQLLASQRANLAASSAFGADERAEQRAKVEKNLQVPRPGRLPWSRLASRLASPRLAAPRFASPSRRADEREAEDRATRCRGGGEVAVRRPRCAGWRAAPARARDIGAESRRRGSPTAAPDEA